MKRAFYALFPAFLLSSCCSRIPSWYTEADCYGTTYRYGKLCFRDTNACKNITLEILRTSDSMLMYVNVLSIPIHPSEDSSCSQSIPCTINLVGSNSSIECELGCLEGGQRFLVPEEMSELILDHLWAGGIIDIHLGRYHARLVPNDFKKAYRTLLF